MFGTQKDARTRTEKEVVIEEGSLSVCQLDIGWRGERERRKKRKKRQSLMMTLEWHHWHYHQPNGVMADRIP